MGKFFHKIHFEIRISHSSEYGIAAVWVRKTIKISKRSGVHLFGTQEYCAILIRRQVYYLSIVYHPCTMAILTQFWTYDCTVRINVDKLRSKQYWVSWQLWLQLKWIGLSQKWMQTFRKTRYCRGKRISE